MTLEVIVLVLSLIAGAVGWSQIKQHGREQGKRERAEEKMDEAIEEAERAAEPPLSGDESVSVLRRLRGKQ